MKDRIIACLAILTGLTLTERQSTSAPAGPPATPPTAPFEWTLERVQIDNRPTDGLQQADLAGDGEPFLIVGANDSTVRWYRQTVDGGWQSHVIASGFVELEGIDAADFDGDDRTEVIALDQGAGKVVLLKADTGDPAGPWSMATLDAAAPMAQSSFVTDVSGNGVPNDVFTIRTDRGEGIYWYEYAGDAGWIEHPVTARGKYRTVSSHDFTGNGIPEVIVSERDGANAVRLYQNVGGEFRMVARQPYAKTDDRMVYLDITGDGRTEFVTTSDHRTFDYWKVDWTDEP